MVDTYIRCGRQRLENPTQLQKEWYDSSDAFLQNRQVHNNSTIPSEIAMRLAPFPLRIPTQNFTTPTKIKFDKNYTDAMELADNFLQACTPPAAAPAAPAAALDNFLACTPPAAPAAPAAMTVVALSPEAEAEPAAPHNVEFRTSQFSLDPCSSYYDMKLSFNDNMKSCWRYAHGQENHVTFIPKEQASFEGRMRESVYEEHTVGMRGIQQLQHFFRTSLTTNKVINDDVHFLNGKTCGIDTSIIVHSDDAFMKTLSTMTQSVYPQHHFEGLY